MTACSRRSEAGTNAQRPHLVHVIGTLDSGGAERTLRLLVEHLAGDFRMTVVALFGEGLHADPIRQGGADVTCLNLSRSRAGARSHWHALAALLQHLRPDLVQAWTYYPNLLASLAARTMQRRDDDARLPVVWNIRHGQLSLINDTLNTHLNAFLGAAGSRLFAPDILINSQRGLERHARYGYPTDRMRLIPNGCETDRYRRDPVKASQVRQELGIPPDAPVVGMVARHHPSKNHPVVLEALAKLRASRPAMHAMLIGRSIDSDNAALIADLERLGLRDRVRLLGVRSDLPALYSAMDLHVLASTNEGSPNTVAESMSCGVPNVVTDVGDAVRLAGPTGTVVPVGDAAALASAIGRLLDRLAKDGLELRSRSHIQSHYSIDRMVDRYRDYWRSRLAANDQPQTQLPAGSATIFAPPAIGRAA